MGKKFSSEYQPKKNGRHPGPTATDILRKLAHTKIDYHNPFSGKKDNADINTVVAIQLILKATQDSDLPSIKEYFDRVDGKVVDKTELSGKLEFTQMPPIRIGGQKKDFNIG